MKFFIYSLLFSNPALASILWDGRFNDISNSTDLLLWSFSNSVGPYQYYIHGTGNVTDYINLSSNFKNPADASSKQGAKISLTSTAYWNGQNMRRTELIPQTTAVINKGKVTYHFSMKRSDSNAPSTSREHQIAFFESHFCEMKYGWVSGERDDSNPNLQFFANSQSQWKTEWEADVWHNVAYEIDFSANTVAFWHSMGSDSLTKVVDAVSVSASSNGADWHLGVLELQRSGFDDTDEDFFFSGVYIEDGDVTTSIGDGTTSLDGSSSAPSSFVASTATKTSASIVTSSAAAATSAVVITTTSSVQSSSTTISSIVVMSSSQSTTVVPTTLSTAVITSKISAQSTPSQVAATSSSVTSSAPTATKTKSACLARRRYRKGVPIGTSQ